MKIFTFVCWAVALSGLTLGTRAQVAISSTGSTPDNSAMLDVQSTTKGLLVPRMTSTQRTAIVTPATGLIVYQTDGAAGFYVNNGTGASPQWLLLQTNTGNDHARLHPMSSVLDHSATNWRLFYSNGSGAVNELSFGTPGQVLSSNGASSAPSWMTPYAGLTNFTESNYTYNTKTGVRFMANNAATNVDLVIQPKGTGSILAQQPDGTAAGGNNRGINAVDLQTSRASAYYVAGGNYAAITGGYSNLAAGAYSFVGAGRYNKVSGAYSAILNGRNDTVASDYSILGGGFNNAIMAGIYSFLGGGYEDTITGSYAFLGGGAYNKVTGYMAAIPGGRSNSVSGSYSVVSGGYGNTAPGGNAAVGGGGSSAAQGTYSFAAGGACIAHDYAETVFGFYPTIATGDSIAYVSTDKLFALGNGTGSSARSNAFTVFKNANTFIGGALTVNGNGTNTSFTFPAVRGTSGQYLKTEENGNTAWATPTNGTVTSVTGTAPISVATATTTPVVSIAAATGSTAGSMSAADKTILDGMTHAIGDSYGGGIVFYVYDNGRHGLIAATADQSTAMRWNAGTNTYTMALADGVGAGKTNTAIIIANQGYGDGATYAARICNEYSVSTGDVTYGDWYLPSKYELNLLYLQKAVVGGFANNSYWSSSEYSSNTGWVQAFNNGLQYTYYKSTPDYVRAVRAF